MENANEKFLDGIYAQFPDLAKEELVDITDKEKFATLNDHMRAEFIRYDNVKRPDLYRLSIMIEKYAAKAYEPLVAVFETEHLYKYVEKRYLELMKSIPKTWVIGGFDNPFFAPTTPPDKAEILTCAGTSLEDTWIVASNGPDGAFGLVAEDLGGVEKGDWFRGFFTTKAEVINKVIEKMNQIMGSNIDLSNKG